MAISIPSERMIVLERYYHRYYHRFEVPWAVVRQIPEPRAGSPAVIRAWAHAQIRRGPGVIVWADPADPNHRWLAGRLALGRLPTDPGTAAYPAARAHPDRATGLLHDRLLSVCATEPLAVSRLANRRQPHREAVGLMGSG